MKMSKGMLMAALITGTLSWGASSAMAAEEVQEFSLDPMIVTATRTEKLDIDVPASTEVWSQEQLKATGAQNVATALKYVSGSAYKSFGPNAASMGTMINEVTIRGIDNGTLVLLNGSPISWRGKYNLDAIPVEAVERVEIVKTGGSVLYGSEAMAGVINIITKKTGSNKVEVGVGNRGQQKYTLSSGNEKFSVVFNHDKQKSKVHVADSSVNYKDSLKPSSVWLKGDTKTLSHDVEKTSLNTNYNINDRLSVSYSYAETESQYDRIFTSIEEDHGQGVKIGDEFNNRRYYTKQHNGQIRYKDDKWKATAFITESKIQADGDSNFLTSNNSKTKVGAGQKKHSWYNTQEKSRTYGADVQRDWKISDKASSVLGFTYQREFYDKSVYAAGDDYSRNHYAVYGEWDQKFDDKNELILGARETWTTGSYRDLNYTNFSASAQYVHKLKENQSLYASVTQSFIMPTFAQIAGNTDLQLPNPDLKPQKGINYEIGWKNITDKNSLKVALYKVNIKDNISATYVGKGTDNAEWQYKNEDFKNYGLEISHEILTDTPWSFKYGLNWQDPKVKESGKKASKDYWDRKYGRVQLNSAVTYKMNKFMSTLSGNYLCDRVQTPSAEKSYKAKPFLLTNWVSTYAPDKNSEFSLSLENILDRRDIVSHSSSSYYCAPFTFMLSYSYKF